jgi:hypothetical protein
MDSTKVEVINHSFDKLVKELSKPKANPVWDTLIGILIGATLTFLAQWSIELWKSRKDRKRLKRELISKGKAKVYLISQTLKELAMYKAHKQYYLSAIELSQKKEEIDDFYNKHYQKGQEQRQTEIKLSEHISDFFQIVAEYQVITRKGNKFENYLDRIIQYEHPKPLEFDKVSNPKELEEKHSAEEKRLNLEFDNLRTIFNDIQILMK